MSKPIIIPEAELTSVVDLEIPMEAQIASTLSPPAEAGMQTPLQHNSTKNSLRSPQTKIGILGAHSPFNPSETMALNNVFEKIFNTLDKIVTKMGIDSVTDTEHTPEPLYVSARTESKKATALKSTWWLKNINTLPKDKKERILWIEQLTNLGKVSGVTVQEVAADILGKVPQTDQAKVLGLFNNLLNLSWETLKHELEMNLLSPQYAVQCELEYYQTFQEEKEITQEWFDCLLRIGGRCRSSISQTIDRRFYDGLKYSIKEFLNTKFPDTFNRTVNELLPAANNFERGMMYNQGLEALKKRMLLTTATPKPN
ncbi:hypothetical protein CONCODRAFT_13896 [Conidiobolus coronatus NRRL 28638]|uniref:Retrotransposon gag domain-containing protein n=1 Tax=Conidiobolus coronatus (strain ATCC 28846 / CBS 209.66 / NRRL 28638) TaxID=796925 RepID=A0A137NPY5_CONC2|nr:hypothetical protein CONCODRAFT_13896 [Conidiobolus coronatus NRRL 28638]|eukprot:KXN64807.1 hypothetical protein CONCODRAFT_13896 [Conidiobolus coronatus NRRL 28638]